MTKITSRADLCGLTLADLQALNHTVEQELLSAQPGSAAWRDALTSLDAIERAIAQRAYAVPAFSRFQFASRSWFGCGTSLLSRLH